MRYSNKNKLGMFTIAGITIAGIFSLRTLPIMAQYGLSSIIWFLIAACLYFIPSALICAELSSAWPKTGGVYIWIRKAFGPRTAFLGIWLEWINNVVALPSSLTFMAITLTFIFDPNLIHSKIYTITMVVGLLWSITFLNYAGIKISAIFTTISLIIGILVPCIALMISAIIWLTTHHTTHIQLSFHALLPHFHQGSVTFLTGLTLGFAGMQVAGFHAQETKNPQRDFPRAIFISVIVILGLSIFSTLAIAVILPKNSINLVTGIMQTVSIFLNMFHLHWLIPFAAFCLVLGSLGALNTWIIGPSKGLLATAEHGDLPKFFSRRNVRGAPTNILFCQAIIGTLLTLVYIFIPSLSSFFWLIVALSALLTLIMDMLLFASALKLRYKDPFRPRPYRVPGGRPSLIIITGVALLTCLLAFSVAFITPTHYNFGSTWFYQSFLAIGVIIFVAIPLITYNNKKSVDKF